MSTLVLPYPSTHPDLCHGKYVAGLFANGEQGAWYDPSDLSTLFQDAYGTTPVTAVGQPVGLILDRRYGAVRGAELFTSPASYLGTLKSGWTFENGAFRAITPQTYSYPTTAGKTYAMPLTVGKTYEIIFTVNATSGSCGANVGSYNVASPGFRSSGTHRVIQKYENVSGIQIQTGGNFVGTIAINSVREIPGNHATQSTTASRPTLQQDTSGKYYLSFDGVDDSLVTGNINFSATDKMTVLTADHSAWDNAVRGITGLSSSAFGYDGTFWLTSYDFDNSTSMAYLRGNLRGGAVYGPDQRTLGVRRLVRSFRFDISKDVLANEMLIRLNGVPTPFTYTPLDPSAGSGNFGNWPLYIGRIGSQYPFSGRLYGLIVRGAQTDDAHLTHAEKYLAYKTGVTL